MDQPATHIVLIIAGMLTVYGALAAAVLFLGNRLSNLGDRKDLAARLRRLHVLALIAFLIGCGLAWMAFESDHPSKEKHLLLPIIFVAIVYGYPLAIELKAATFAWGAYILRQLFRRP
jgi:hypothetical protein